MIMCLTVRCFSVSDKHGQTSNVVWLSTRLKIKSLYSQSLLLHRENVFCWCIKIIRNWFLILEPDIFLNYLQFTKAGRRKDMDVIWAPDVKQYIFYALIYALTYLMRLCERKKSFIKIPTLILHLKL